MKPDQNFDQIPDEPQPSRVQSLKELIDYVSGRTAPPAVTTSNTGSLDLVRYPFLALVGQDDLKLALTLLLINPMIGSVLIAGPHGTGKTTAVRSLAPLLPIVERSNCPYGCTPKDIENGGVDAVCPDCARKYGEGEALTQSYPISMVEVPPHATISDWFGVNNDYNTSAEPHSTRRSLLLDGIGNIVFLDKFNLMAHNVIDLILEGAEIGHNLPSEVASQHLPGNYTVIGTMAPEDGLIEPHILDRFGLRVIGNGLDQSKQRFDAYQRVAAYRNDPQAFTSRYENETAAAKAEIESAKSLLPDVTISEEVALFGINAVNKLNINSLRAEIALFEAARAHAAADKRITVTISDLQIVGPLALRLRTTGFESANQLGEEDLKASLGL